MTATNGTYERAIEDARGGMRRADLAARYGMSDGWAGKVIRASGRTLVRNGAAQPVPVTGANTSPGEAQRAPSPARPNGTGAKAVTSVKARRQRHLIVAMIVVASLVAAAVGTLSYSLIVALASVAGTGWHAFVLPVALDGMYLCGAICLAIDPKYLPAKLAIGIGLVASMATQWIAADEPSKVVDLELAARTLSSFTPLCLFLCVVFILHAYKVRR